MNHIQMYASSTHLKHGLHRVLAVAHALTSELNEGVIGAWWSVLEPEEQEAARLHRLSMEGLARVYARAPLYAMVDAGRARLGLPKLDLAAVQGAFKVAIISGKAHRAHMGRDVYGTSNKGLWDLVCSDFGQAVAVHFGIALGEEPIAREASRPSDDTIALLQTLTGFDTSPKGDGHEACVGWLTQQLTGHGFAVEARGQDLGPPLIVAHREARGLAGHVVLYGHYDTTPFGGEQRWEHPPRTLTLADGRLHARGVADNKGPLACRLAALPGLRETPALTWFIQGEEETGSAVARAHLPALMRDLRPTIWLDETGYHDHEDGTLRLLGRSVGPDDESRAPDDVLVELLQGLCGLASRWGIAARHERRGLNKSVVEGGCPFNHALPEGARYLAIGVNDSKARIHGLNESLPGWTFPLHAAELDVVFHWVDRVARSGA